MTRLNIWKFVLATAVTFVVLDAVCAIAVTLSPEGTVGVFNTWFHGLDLKLLMPPGGRSLSVGQITTGIVSAAIVSFVGGAVLAGSYNLFGRTGRQ